MSDKISSLNWVEKYRPQDLGNVAGHPTAIEELRNWALLWEEGNIPKNRALILHGKPGVGKTTSALALAREMGWEVLELNASDKRTAKIINDVVEPGSQMSTIEGTKRLIIMDEADNIYGKTDRGGEGAILKVIKKTNHPIILTANDLYAMSYLLRSACKVIKFRAISQSTIISILKKIANAENIIAEPGTIEKIAENTDGDLRSAINDLQAIVQGRKKIDGKYRIGIKDLITGTRDVKENIFKVLEKIFKGSNIIDAYKATFSLDENPEDFIKWVDENLPYEYTRPQDLENGFEALSKADLYLARVKRRRNYRLWKYANVLMTAGVVIAKSNKYGGYSKYQKPSIIKRMADTRNDRTIRDSLAKKIGMHCHASMRFTRLELFPFFRMLFKNNDYATPIAASLGLNQEEIAYLQKKTMEEIKDLYNSAQAIIDKDTKQQIETYGGFGSGKKKEEKKEEKKDKAQSSLFDF